MNVNRSISILLVALLTALAAPVAAAPSPSIKSFSPSSACVGTEVKIEGSGFNSVTSVKFNGTPASFTRQSNGQVIARVPSGATSGPISVTTNQGTATSSSSFTVRTTGCPSIASFSPARGPVGTEVVIVGSGFTGASAVQFGGVGTDRFTIDSDSQITATVPSGARTGPIGVTAPGGHVVSAGSFTVTTEPTVTSINPTTGCAGALVSIAGTDLSGATEVRFAGVPSRFTVESSTITATVPTGATSGRITVTTPSGTATSPTDFTVPTGCPGIATFTPTTGQVGTEVTITGSNFSGTTSVLFNGVGSQFTVLSPTQIRTKVPTGARTGPITVTNAAGSTTSTDPFEVEVFTGLAIASFNPVTGPVGSQVTILGSGFVGVTGVRFGSIPTAPYTVHSSTRITAVVPAGASTGAIYVVTSAGTAQSPDAFEVTPPGSPTITSFSPAAGMSGTQVTIVGTGFSTTSSVTFDGSEAEFVVQSSTHIVATVPFSPRTGPIRVTNLSGTARSSTDFVVTDAGPPTITSFSPTSAEPGARVILNGTNLSGTTMVAFNGTQARFVVHSPTQISAVVPDGATTGPISVDTPTGTFTTSDPFVVLVPEDVVHPRTVTLTLRRRLVAKGTVSSLEVDCARGVTVKIQRRRDGVWRTLTRTTTNDFGAYRVSIRNRTGAYRARLPLLRLNESELCTKATSPTRRHIR